RFFEIASMSSWFPTLVDAHGPLECRPTALITQSVVLNLRRLDEVGRLRCHGIAMMEAIRATECLNSLFDVRGRGHWAVHRRILGEPEMRSVVMVMPDVLHHEAFQ